MAQGYRASRLRNLCRKGYGGKRYPGFILCPTSTKNYAKWKTTRYERRRGAEIIREEFEQFDPNEDL